MLGYHGAMQLGLTDAETLPTGDPMTMTRALRAVIATNRVIESITCRRAIHAAERHYHGLLQSRDRTATRCCSVSQMDNSQRGRSNSTRLAYGWAASGSHGRESCGNSSSRD